MSDVSDRPGGDDVLQLQAEVARLTGGDENWRSYAAFWLKARERAGMLHARAVGWAIAVNVRRQESNARVAQLEKALRAWQEVPDSTGVTVEQVRAERLTRVALAPQEEPTSTSAPETIAHATAVKEELRCKECGGSGSVQCSDAGCDTWFCVPCPSCRVGPN